MASSRRNTPLYTNHNTSNKDYRGCMGGLMHLFDFNQALAGRKLLTDKRSAAGLEAPKKSLDVGHSISEAYKSQGEKSEEVLKASAPRRLNGMPIKALIAQELSKESDNKNRAPSVVARLMGLDALPTESKVLEKPSAGGKLGKLDEKFTQRSVVERQRHEESTHHNIGLYAKKAKASVVSGQKSSGLLRGDSQDGKSGPSSQPLRNHPQEQQLQEFKKEFEAWQSQKSCGHSRRSNRLDDTQAHLFSPQGFQNEKWFNTMPWESFSSVKPNSLQDRLHESREFQDAVDFLQSNKELFMRFLQEPNSLFARHLQGNESGSVSPPQTIEGIKQRQRCHAADASEESRPQSWAKDSHMSRQCLKSDGREESRPSSWAKESPMLRSAKSDVMVERSILSMPHSPLICSEESPNLQGRYRNAFSPMAPENCLYNTSCHIPTRIVVLKPSPGKVRNLKSVSPVCCRSPKDQDANDGFREDSMDVLERLREKLQKDSSAEYKCERRSAGVNIDEQQYRGVSKDPREIAREIARQVRENITRDLMVDPRCLGNTPSTVRDSDPGRRSMQATDSGDTSASNMEASGLANRPSQDHYPRYKSVSLHPDKSSDLEALHESTEVMVSALDQVRTNYTRVSDGSMSLGHDFGSKHGVFHKDSNGSRALGQKVLHTSKRSTRYHLNCYLNDPQAPSIFDKLTNQVTDPTKSDPAFDLEHLALDEHAEEKKAGISTTLFRSHSANLATPGNENMAGLQIYGRDNLEDLVGSARVAHNIVVDLIRPTDINTHSAELATKSSSSTKHVEHSGDLGMGEVMQTVVRMEEHIGSHTREEMGATNTNKLLSSSCECSVLDEEFYASLCGTCVVDSTSIDILSRQKHGTLLSTNNLSVDALLDLTGPDGASSCNAQTMEAMYLNNDANIKSKGQSLINRQDVCVFLQAPIDNTAPSPPFVSLFTSDLSAGFIAGPAKEQPEHPSPISVLDLPLQEELVVATEFKELSSDIEELRACLSLDNSGTGDNDQHNADNFESVLDASVHLEKIYIAEGGHADCMRINENDAPSKSSCNVEEMGKESEMLYVENLLSASGFVGDGSTALMWWYAPGQPLNPCLFQEMESSSSDREKDIREYDQAASKLNKQGKEKLNILRRRLLFDSANEALLSVLGHHFDQRLWLSSPKLVLRVPTGQDLVKLVWSCVWCSLRSHSGSQETLENLVTKDLGKGGDWLDVGVEIEAAGLDVERAILDDLIEEALLVL